MNETISKLMETKRTCAMEWQSSPLSSLVSPLGGVADTLEPRGDVLTPVIRAWPVQLGGAIVVAEILCISASV